MKMKKLKSILIFSMMAIFLLSGVALADWSPGDGHKMHEPQLPNWDMEGWDVNATYPIVLADDWLCTETGYVKDLHFWGSWLWDMVGTIDSFLISFHYNIPVGPNGWSIPGPPIDQFLVFDQDWIEAGRDVERCLPTARRSLDISDPFKPHRSSPL